MESMVVITHSSGLPGGRLNVFGDLDLVQKTPLVCSTRKPIRINKPTLLFESSDWLVNIYEEYSKRTRKLFVVDVKYYTFASINAITIACNYSFYHVEKRSNKVDERSTVSTTFRDQNQNQLRFGRDFV